MPKTSRGKAFVGEKDYIPHFNIEEDVKPLPVVLSESSSTMDSDDMDYVGSSYSQKPQSKATSNLSGPSKMSVVIEKRECGIERIKQLKEMTRNTKNVDGLTSLTELTTTPIQSSRPLQDSKSTITPTISPQMPILIGPARAPSQGTPTDDEEYRSKRDRNNYAVRKCRMKKKLREHQMEGECRRVRTENERLWKRIRELEGELELERKKSTYLAQILNKLEIQKKDK